MVRDRLEVADFRPDLSATQLDELFKKISTQNLSAHYLTDTFLDEVGASNSTRVVRSWRGGSEFEYRVGGRVRLYPIAFLMMSGASDSDRVLLRVLQASLPTKGEDLLSFYPPGEIPISLTNPVMLTVVTCTEPHLPGIYLDHGSRRWELEGFDGWLLSNIIPDLRKRV